MSSEHRDKSADHSASEMRSEDLEMDDKGDVITEDERKAKAAAREQKKAKDSTKRE
jgi:hypothetical protein